MSTEYGPKQPNKQWPFPLAPYDRSPTLRLNERQALADWQAQKHSLFHSPRTFSKQTRPKLLRLIQPIEDVLFYCGFTEHSSPIRVRTCCLQMLHEMHIRQTTFWAWEEQEWVSIIGYSPRNFESNFQLFKTVCCVKDPCYRHCIMMCAYLLRDIPIFKLVTEYQPYPIARRIFGAAQVDTTIATIVSEVKRIGRGNSSLRKPLITAIGLAVLFNRSYHIEDFSLPLWIEINQYVASKKYSSRACKLATLALHNLNILPRALPYKQTHICVETGTEDNLSTEWLDWLQRWHTTSTLSKHTRDTVRALIARAARWAMEVYPSSNSPTQWTQEMCIAFVAAVTRMKIGQWQHPKANSKAEKLGKPPTAGTKAHVLYGLRVFFMDCQEWQWLPRAFNPQRCLATPKSLTLLIGPDPRVIADDYWAKLLSAGLSLTKDDLPIPKPIYMQNTLVEFTTFYPWELVRAVVIVWLFTGLRASEIRRLRVGCISWQPPKIPSLQEDPSLNSNVCMLNVPVNKTSTAFVKPVDRLVGEAISAWEKVRPSGPAQWDEKTGESVHFLFQWRGLPIGTTYLNETLIPMLCRKAGIPEEDARGQITSHRARSTIATQLYNAREPMTLFELQEWLGHRTPYSTQQYAKILPTKLAKAYIDADYFSRNTRLIRILVDQEAIKSGAAASGEPWKSYDLGHGYCTYDFFDKCPHRMACAKCSFYRPKGSSAALLLEGKANLLWMLQEIPLNEDEREAVEDGIEAMAKLCERLANVPTPTGLTPNELNRRGE